MQPTAAGLWQLHSYSFSTLPCHSSQGPDYFTIGKNKPVTNFDAACERQSPGTLCFFFFSRFLQV